jgi:hypothetical protein
MSERDSLCADRKTGVLVFFRGGPWDGRTERLPDDRDRWAVPHKPEIGGAFYFGMSLGPLPQPAIYQRTYPREYERVLTRDVIVKKGTRLQDFDTPWDHAVVFDCIAEGGR